MLKMNDKTHIVNLLNTRDEIHKTIYNLSLQMLACGYEEDSNSYINATYRNLSRALSDAVLFSDQIIEEYIENERHALQTV